MAIIMSIPWSLDSKVYIETVDLTLIFIIWMYILMQLQTPPVEEKALEIVSLKHQVKVLDISGIL